MINSDLLVDSLDNEDEEDGNQSNLLESLEECKDEVNTPSLFHKGTGSQPFSPQVLEYYSQGNQQFCDQPFLKAQDKLTLEDDDSEQEEFIVRDSNQLEIVIEEDQYCHRQNSEESDFELSDTLYKQ